MQHNAVSPARRALTAGGLTSLLLLATAGYAQGGGTGVTSSTDARATEGALQQLATPGGVNLAAPKQGSFGGSLVEGNATDAVIDLWDFNRAR